MSALTEALAKALEGKSEQEQWAILTALRGPDFVHTMPIDKGPEWQALRNLKRATTAVIRYHVFKATSEGQGMFDISPDSERYRDIRRALYALRAGNPDKYLPLWHFLRHAQDAFYALGLKWEEVNP